ncbi:MAG: hypothetical protein LKM31_10810 [Sphingobium sp.]|jgi:hypothetical protein|uniref:DUF5983 family protein n=1 Tax=Sphingobium sp. JS3065 TaxID=2970925 RepID=UPI002264F398|nr:hypothetical protein [Sphingobium sp. JS3065]MCI1271665.1 hypothetical protein [Sphingobium sp.]MCI1756215.1 hypothetical protein [Sphingobium sp.]MCI2053866.1 hypothetical protein [Sphingobium sp.]UZW56621.1 hypothetical protein NUH86_07680 [Sphingobium sp. JS3065]
MIERMLVLSTANVTAETCNVYLHTAPFAAFEKGDYGWFVYVPIDLPDDLPADLAGCFDVASRAGVDWIMLDRDAQEHPGLPAYDW